MNLPDDTNGDNNQLILVNNMLQLQRRMNALTEEEKLPSCICKQVNTNPLDWKFWSQISSEGEKKIVKCISPGESEDNLQVMQGVFQALLHQMHKDESHNDEAMEDSTDSNDTTDPYYLINQARSQNKSDNKLEKASEIFPGHPARVMSSREGRD